MSGSPAYIVAGRHILYRERWAYFTRRYAAVGERVVSQRIETGFDVIPVVVGRQANVRIVPRISHMDAHGRRGIIQFTGAATRLTVPLGQWVRIGGTQQQSNEVIRAILASGSASQSSSVVISLKVETR
jgi:hypothetical protein